MKFKILLVAALINIWGIQGFDACEKNATQIMSLSGALSLVYHAETLQNGTSYLCDQLTQKNTHVLDLKTNGFCAAALVTGMVCILEKQSLGVTLHTASIAGLMGSATLALTDIKTTPQALLTLTVPLLIGLKNAAFRKNEKNSLENTLLDIQTILNFSCLLYLFKQKLNS